jgi:hypothetical protein
MLPNLNFGEPPPEFDLISHKEDVLAKSFISAARGSNSYKKTLGIRLLAKKPRRRL